MKHKIVNLCIKHETTICESPSSCFMCSENLAGFFMVVTSSLVYTFTFEHQAVMSKKLSLANFTLLIPLIQSSIKTKLLMFKTGITKWHLVLWGLIDANCISAARRNVNLTTEQKQCKFNQAPTVQRVERAEILFFFPLQGYVSRVVIWVYAGSLMLLSLHPHLLLLQKVHSRPAQHNRGPQLQQPHAPPPMMLQL